MTENGDDTVDELLEAIYALSKANNLAAVVVHMNDTYLIEEQCLNNKLYLPGLARVATLTGRIREAVQKETGEDRTLVVHSGDYLSPSYLSNKCGTQGRHMVELLGLCGVSYATLGNHEGRVRQ